MSLTLGHAGNEDIHKSLYEFEFRTDPTTDYGVSCPWASKKSMSNSRTYIKAYMSSNFRQIRLLTTELAALERLKHQCLYLLFKIFYWLYLMALRWAIVALWATCLISWSFRASYRFKIFSPTDKQIQIWWGPISRRLFRNQTHVPLSLHRQHAIYSVFTIYIINELIHWLDIKAVLRF